MKKKPQLSNVLDDLRHQDSKTRLTSLAALKDIASALGPARTRTQLLQYLQQFVDDEEEVVDELLTQLSNFRTELGGEEHEKQLLPLLICFCKTDEMKHTEKALLIMDPILGRNKDLILDVVKKLSKVQMNTSKHSAVYLTSRLIQLVPQQQSQLLQIFSGMVFSDVPSYKIIASKLMGPLLEKVKNKEEVGKMLEVIYNDNDDLAKIFALETLVNYFPVNNNFVANKFKLMLGVGNWRINAKICEVVPLCAKLFTKPLFKATFQQPLLKFLVSNEAQLRAKSCSLLKHMALGMAEEEMKKNIIPIIKKLAVDPVNFVKVSASQNFIPLVEVMTASLINEELLPIILTFLKSNDLAVGVLKNFEILTKKFSSEVIEQKILTPLVSQLSTDDWKAKCVLIDLLTGVISNSFFLNDQLTTTLVRLTEDKIGAVRQKATTLIVNIILQQSPQWCDSMLIPKIQCLRESSSYIERQIMLEIIEKTSQKVSQKTLNDVYRQTVMNNLSDKVPNVRARALKVLKNSKILNDRSFDKCVEKLKGDSDAQVKRLAGEMGK